MIRPKPTAPRGAGAAPCPESKRVESAPHWRQKAQPRKSASSARLLWLGLSAAPLVVACGNSANDEIPQELLDAIGSQNMATDDYPSQEQGGEVGDVAHNVCIRAWTNPTEAEFDPSALNEKCLGDYWTPESATPGLLLVNTAAGWCTACRIEYGGTGSRPSLAEEVSERAARGLTVLGAFFQDAEREPATEEDAVLWADRFDVSFNFGLDERFVMGAFGDSKIQPLNMLIDTRTMEIVFKLQGDDPDTLWPTVDSLLSPSKLNEAP